MRVENVYGNTLDELRVFFENIGCEVHQTDLVDNKLEVVFSKNGNYARNTYKFLDEETLVFENTVKLS